MKPSPLRFIVVTLGLWTGIRAVTLLRERSAMPPQRIAVMPAQAQALVRAVRPLPRRCRPQKPAAWRATGRAARNVAASPPGRPGALTTPTPAPRAPPPPPSGVVSMPVPVPAPLAATLAPPPRPGLSGEAYLFLRPGSGGALAPGAPLGGSQVFARITAPFAADGRLGATVRASRALNGPGSEAAVGLRWTPFAAAPLSLSGERRVALDAAGRDAWSIGAAAGLYDAPVGAARLDAYVQAGLVGWRRRDGFVDGAMRLGLALGQGRLGAGLWGAAQPGAARVDLGPQATIRLSPGLTAALDGRIRIAGNARPGSGITLTLATGF